MELTRSERRRAVREERERKMMIDMLAKGIVIKRRILGQIDKEYADQDPDLKPEEKKTYKKMTHIHLPMYLEPQKANS